MASGDSVPGGPFHEGAFTSAQVMRLSGITKRQLDYWIAKGIISADIDRAQGRGRVRLFSFANLVEVRVAAWLRDRVSLQLIGKIVERLRSQDMARPLAEATVGVVEETRRGTTTTSVLVRRADGSWEEWEGQKIMEITIPLKIFAEELRESVDADRRRARRVGRVERRRGVLGSTEVVAGTRIPTSAIRNLLRAGYDVEAILDAYPGLERADIEAVMGSAEARPSKAAAG